MITGRALLTVALATAALLFVAASVRDILAEGAVVAALHRAH